MNEMKIESAVYSTNYEGKTSGINAVIDGVTMSVPLDPQNRHYAEIMRQVASGTLTIAEAVTPSE
jgi:hypothetical protein